MEVDILSSVRLMSLDMFVSCNPYLFLTGEFGGRKFAGRIRKRTPGSKALLALGRGESCDIVVPDATVSQVHALFRLHGDSVEVFDAGSRNGTWANGASLAGCVTARVVEGARLRFGRVELTVCGPHAAWDVIRRLPHMR